MSNSIVHSSKAQKKPKASAIRPIDARRAIIRKFIDDATDFETALRFFERQIDTAEIRDQIISDVKTQQMTQTELEEILGIALSQIVQLKNLLSVQQQFSDLAIAFRNYMSTDTNTKRHPGRPINEEAFNAAREIYWEYLAIKNKPPSSVYLRRHTNDRIMVQRGGNKQDGKTHDYLSNSSAKNYCKLLSAEIANQNISGNN